MTLLMDDPVFVETLKEVIARSPIIVEECGASDLPAGFEDVDLAILAWIAAEGRRIGRRAVRM